jgi:malonate decarboxylase delta subunit
VQTLTYTFPAEVRPARRAHVGVVASGDLEVLLDLPGADAPSQQNRIRVRTSVTGFDDVWRSVLERFFEHHPVLGEWEINDFGATPGVVALRLQQVLAHALSGEKETP